MFNNSLISDKDLIRHIKEKQLLELKQTNQTKWKLLKQRICHFSINYNQKASKTVNKNQFNKYIQIAASHFDQHV